MASSLSISGLAGMPLNIDIMKNPTTIVAVDDHPLIRQAIRSLVAGREDMVLVGEGSAGEHLLPLVDAYQPDVVVLDLNMPQFAAPGHHTPQDTFAALPVIARLHQEYPETAVIILSQHLISSVVHEGVGRSNIKGYLLKSDDLSLMLPQAIEMVCKGSVFFSEAVREELFERPGRPLLTKRQIEIIETIARASNASYAQHAATLRIAESTLRNHLTQAYRALAVNNITAAILRCKELGIISSKQGREDS